MTDAMKKFFFTEFNLKTLDGLTGNQIKELYEKCYDIEVEEELKPSDSKRGLIASECVNYLYNNFANK